MAKIKVQVFGTVQGVFFRHSARQQALLLHLAGWVKNLPDGSVLSEAEGKKESLLEFIAWCKRGPERAQVKDVTVEWLEETGQAPAADFSIIN